MLFKIFVVNDVVNADMCVNLDCEPTCARILSTPVTSPVQTRV
jgi:hypothetical protein